MGFKASIGPLWARVGFLVRGLGHRIGMAKPILGGQQLEAFLTFLRDEVVAVVEEVLLLVDHRPIGSICPVEIARFTVLVTGREAFRVKGAVLFVVVADFFGNGGFFFCCCNDIASDILRALSSITISVPGQSFKKV